MNTIVQKPFENVGIIDAVVRAVLALTLIGIVIGADLTPAQSFPLIALSIPTMLFALIRWDPIYSLFNKGEKKESFKA